MSRPPFRARRSAVEVDQEARDGAVLHGTGQVPEYLLVPPRIRYLSPEGEYLSQGENLSDYLVATRINPYEEK